MVLHFASGTMRSCSIPSTDKRGFAGLDMFGVVPKSTTRQRALPSNDFFADSQQCGRSHGFLPMNADVVSICALIDIPESQPCAARGGRGKMKFPLRKAPPGAISADSTSSSRQNSMARSIRCSNSCPFHGNE